MNRLELVTDRLRLRLVESSDLDLIHELHSLPETDKFNTLGIPKDVEETRSIINKWNIENQRGIITNYTFIIEQKKDNSFVGLFGLKLGVAKFRSGEVWYKIHSNSWNEGYATEVLVKVLDYCFTTLLLHRVEAGSAVENIGSIKVLEKVGMLREGRGRSILPLISGWSDNYVYSILETDKRATS